MHEAREVQSEKVDCVEMAINPPTSKLPQFTIIPTGGVNAFAVSKTIQQFGKKDAFKDMTPMEYYMNKIFEYNRSRGGVMVAGVLKLALAKVESEADQATDRKIFLDKAE